MTTRGKTWSIDKKIEIAVLFCTQLPNCSCFLNSYSYLEAGRGNSVFLWQPSHCFMLFGCLEIPKKKCNGKPKGLQLWNNSFGCCWQAMAMGTKFGTRVQSCKKIEIENGGTLVEKGRFPKATLDIISSFKPVVFGRCKCDWVVFPNLWVDRYRLVSLLTSHQQWQKLHLFYSTNV